MYIRDEDKSKLDKIVEGSKISRDREIKDPTTSGRALRDYAMYGKKSSYLRRPTLKEIKSMTPTYLLEQANKAMTYELDIFYTGTMAEMTVKNQIKSTLNISDNLVDSNSPVTIDYKKHKRNKIFLIDDPTAVQSQIYFIAKGKVLDEKNSFSGTSGVVSFGKSTTRMIEEFLLSGMEHHIAFTYGDIYEDLLSLGNQLKIPVYTL